MYLILKLIGFIEKMKVINEIERKREYCIVNKPKMTWVLSKPVTIAHRDVMIYWLDNIHRENENSGSPIRTSYICKLHFEIDSIHRESENCRNCRGREKELHWELVQY